MQTLTISDEVVPAIYSLNVKQRFKATELILSAGDLPFYYIEFVVTMLGAPCYYVWGNHDGPEERGDGNVVKEVQGANCLDGSAVNHHGRLLAGLGGSIRYKPNASHQFTESEMMRRAWLLTPRLFLNRWRYGRYLDVLLTHSPPLGIHNGPDYPHRGFTAFLWLMDHFQPRYLVHGHIHLNYGFDSSTESTYRQTKVINTAGYRTMKL